MASLKVDLDNVAMGALQHKQVCSLEWRRLSLRKADYGLEAQGRQAKHVDGNDPKWVLDISAARQGTKLRKRIINDYDSEARGQQVSYR